MNQKITELYRLPVTCSALSEEPEFSWGPPPGIGFEFEEYGDMSRRIICFDKIWWYSFSSTYCCTPWHINSSFDCLVEVVQSEAIADLSKKSESARRRFGKDLIMRHFMIYLDEVGCYQIIASRWSVISMDHNNIGDIHWK
jgi:hypothetical protein